MTRPGAAAPDGPETSPRRLDAPKAVRWITRTLEEAGFETWAVGGAVRDVIRGGASVDWDFATRARPEDVLRLFRRTVPIGIDHGTVGVLSREGTLYEVTTFRRDVEPLGRRAVVQFSDRLEDDLARRDFTINAVAWHPLREEVVDPFGGVRDLELGVLRTVGEPEDRFREDYLRVLRALRFAGRFGLTIEDATWGALRAAVEHLTVLSPERVREELTKVLAQDARPSLALGLWASSGALGKLAPELGALGQIAVAGLPAETDAWTFACVAAEEVPRSRSDVRLAVLGADVGLPAAHGGSGASSGDEGPKVSPWHVDERGRRRMAQLLLRLRFSNAAVDRVVGAVAGGGDPPPADGSPAEYRRWLAAVGPDRLPDLIRVWGARARARSGLEGESTDAIERVLDVGCRLRTLARTRPALTVGDLALTGGDLIRLGLKPGPEFGEILDGLLDVVLEDPESNRLESLEAIVRTQWLEKSSS